MRTLPTNFGTPVTGNDVSDWAKKAGLDWGVKSVALGYRSQGQHMQSSRRAIIRDDNGTELGIVSPKYHAVQPIDVLNIFKNASDNYGFNIDRIGSHGDGKIIWGRADADSSFRIKGQDKVDGYLYIITSFDGSVATKMMIGSVRVACMNALNLVDHSAGLRQTWRHNSVMDPLEPIENLEAYMKGWNTFEQDANDYAEIAMSKEEVIEFALKALQKHNPTERVIENAMPYIASAFDSPGSNLTSVKMGADKISLWGAINGITYAVDHLDKRGAGNPYFASFGSGSDIKGRALSAANDIRLKRAA